MPGKLRTIDCLWGMPYGSKGYISLKLLGKLFAAGILPITKIKRTLAPHRCLLPVKYYSKRFVIETVNGELKNICSIEHSCNRGFTGFLANAWVQLPVGASFRKNFR